MMWGANAVHNRERRTDTPRAARSRQAFVASPGQILKWNGERGKASPRITRHFSMLTVELSIS
jgi:hypothetical protein